MTDQVNWFLSTDPADIGVLVHLHACVPCGEDFDGMLAAVAAEAHPD
ncbi:hypothetical protein [Mycolicibacterium mengxianglii]|nr:hypothetical protein [Mycolicibacterium mengxianglii]